ncbi:hypothetical protein B0T21DRAFT_375076 [Apiosordaria backusii]|uniref:Uncharacterized protein n=1 Tax=Apiosordaria backusii TaxID=314023 RepID=A0AA40AIK2_9PEZI|nr:hypothetical protein B0T21DRAFT_375076 [Apiosordaria backusii]
MPPKKETPYPEKQSYRSKGLKLDTAAYAETLTNAYKTTRDIASQVKEEVLPFIKKARARVNSLIEIIQQLRKEIRIARDALIIANKDDLYPSLMAIEEVGDPLYWRQDEEFKEAP